MARLAEIWATNLEKRIIAAKTKEEKFSILLKECTVPDQYGLIHTDQNVSRDVPTDYELYEMTKNKRANVIGDLAIKHDLMKEWQNHYDNNIPQNWGSSPDQKSLEYLYCANVNRQTYTACLKRGTLRCCGCFLVAYCSKTCQTEHWQKHKEDCKSELVSSSWKPSWILQGRLPRFFTGDCIPEHMFKKHIWGTSPAFDVMRWRFNEMELLSESTVYEKPISMAFIDAGDLRNVMETLASVPENVTSPLHIVINDSNAVVAARNFLMLLALGHGVKAIDAVLEVWYSSCLTQMQFCMLIDLLKPTNGLARECFHFRKTDSNTFSLNLFQANVVLNIVRRMLDENLSDIQAISNKRLKVLFDPRQHDRLDSYNFHLKPHQRLAWLRFRKTGLFLPYSGCTFEFNTANQFIMKPGSTELPMGDNVDPFSGWDMRNVAEFAKIHKLPYNDIVGCLYFYVRDRLMKALATLERLPVQIDLYCKEPTDLAKTLSSKVNEKFDRIYASNLADENYVGLLKLMSDWVPLLNEKNDNSVLITLFTNWFGKNYADLSENELLELKKNCCPEKIAPALAKFLNGNRGALRILQDESEEFQEFLVEKMKNLKKLKVAPRQQHSIVPHRLFAPIEAAENFTFRDISDEEIYFIGDSFTKCTLRERYVEWVLN